MATLTSRTITDMTGAGGRLLHELCKELGVGKTQQGTARQFTLEDAAPLMLIATLRDQGLRHSETIAIAQKAKDELARFMHNPDSPERWLIVWRLGEDDEWNIDISDSSGSPEVLDREGSRAGGYIVVNLRWLARDILDAAEGRGTIKVRVRRLGAAAL
jgi:hypothetical protein